MQYSQRSHIHHSHYRPFTLFCSSLLLSLIILSACSSTNDTGNMNGGTSKPLPTGGVSATLKNQGEMQLETFQQWITLFKQNGGDITTYQQQYDSDQKALTDASTETSYKTALDTLNTHVTAIQIPAMKQETATLRAQMKQKVTAWGQQHTYHDTYDNQTYPLAYEYSDKGIGGDLDEDLANATTVRDYQEITELVKKEAANFDAMVVNSSDSTPWDQAHKADLQLLDSYDRMHERAIVVSLSEQAMRIYENGKLVKAFQVTTGTPAHPSLPGAWWVEGKQAPTTFHSPAPQGSPDWYPDTHINFAIQYHSNGYFLHDSWWRNQYGPGTNFPHEDPRGDSAAQQGSHGCVNLSTENANWVYDFVKVYTPIIIY